MASERSAGDNCHADLTRRIESLSTSKVMKFRLESALALAAPDSKEWDRRDYGLTRSVPTAISRPLGARGDPDGDDSKAIPEVPANYMLDFQPDGRVAVRADCNRGSGTYSVSGSQISFGPIAPSRGWHARQDRSTRSSSGGSPRPLPTCATATRWSSR